MFLTTPTFPHRWAIVLCLLLSGISLPLHTEAKARRANKAESKAARTKNSAKDSPKSCAPVISASRLEVLHPVTRKKIQSAMSDMQRSGLRPRLTTTFRSRSEQNSLYRCARKKRCRQQRGIFDAARPGSSLHEAGLAVDVAGVAYGNRRTRRLTRDGQKIVRIMKRNGFDWRYGLGDPVHFEINPRQAGYRSDRKAIQDGQQRWIAQNRVQNCKLKKADPKAAATGKAAPTTGKTAPHSKVQTRLQKVTNPQRPSRKR